MEEHKIQSSTGPLTVSLELVPKMLKPLVSMWGSSLFVVSFKLETDSTQLTKKALSALQKYNHSLVIGNLLQTRRDEVVFVTKDKQDILKLSNEEKKKEIEIEQLIVDEVCLRHKSYIN